MSPSHSTANLRNVRIATSIEPSIAPVTGEAAAAKWFVTLIALTRFVPNGIALFFAHVYGVIALCSRDLRTRLGRVAVGCNNLRSPWSRLCVVERNVAAKILSRIHHFQLLRCSEARLRNQVRFGKGRELLRASRDTPTLILSAHYIGFEAALIRLSAEVSGAVVVESTGNAPLDRELARCWSRFLPQRVICARGGLRKVLAELRSKQTVALLVEHMGNSSNYVEVELRHKMSLRMSPATRLILRVPNVRVLWMSVAPCGSGRYLCEFNELAGSGGSTEASFNALIGEVGGRLAQALPLSCWNTAPLNFRN